MSKIEILGKTFFPGSRKEIKLNKIEGLRDKEGNPRIKVELIMSLADGKQVGMPSWIGEAYDHLGKQDTLETSTTFDAQMEGMSLYIHELPESKDPAKTAFSCMFANFRMTREGDDEKTDELGDVALKFVAYIPGDKRLWTWLYDYNKAKLWIRFECTQAELIPDAAPKQETQLPLGGDDFEAQRQEATSKAHDAEFDAPAKPKDKTKADKPKLVAAGSVN